MRYDVLAPPGTAAKANLVTVDFVSATEGFIGTSNGLILRTTDAGLTWAPRAQPSTGTINKLVFTSPTDGWACTSTGLYHTTNGGQSWQPVAPTTLDDAIGDVQFVTPLIGYAVGASIYKTTDGGQHWTDQRVWPSYFDATTEVSFSSPDSGMAVGKDRCRYVTTDGGRNWTSRQGSSTLDWHDVLTYTNGGFVLTGEGGFFEYGSESGYDYQQPDESFSYPIYGLAYWAPLQRLVAVGENSIIRRHPEFSLNQSTPWVYVHAPDGSSIQRTFRAADFADANTFYAVGDSGTIYRFHYQ